jgi:hypothetical protein
MFPTASQEQRNQAPRPGADHGIPGGGGRGGGLFSKYFTAFSQRERNCRGVKVAIAAYWRGGGNGVLNVWP